MVSREWRRASALGALSMRTAPGTPSSLGGYPRKRDWECNPRNVFPGTASGIYPWEQNWERYSRNSTGTVSGHHAPAFPPPRTAPPPAPPGLGEDGDTASGSQEPPAPRNCLHPTGDCVPPVCPAGYALTELGQPQCTGDRTGDTCGCVFWTQGTRGT